MKLFVQEPKLFQSIIGIKHFPKHPLCDICNRAKLFSTRIRSHRILDPESDLPESSKFGEQVAVDHMVVWKSSGGKSFLF